MSGHPRSQAVALSLILALLGTSSTVGAGPASRREAVLVHSYDAIHREASERMCFLMFYEAFSTAITHERNVVLTTRHSPETQWQTTDADVYAHCRILRDVFYLKVTLSRKDKDPGNMLRVQRTIVDTHGQRGQLEEALESAAAQATRSIAE